MLIRLLGIPILIAAAPALAQQIAIIDLNAAIAGTREGKQRIAEILEIRNNAEARARKQQAEIEALRERLKLSSHVLSQAARNELVEDIEDRTRKLRRDLQDAETDIKWKQTDIANEIAPEIIKTVAEYAKTHDLDLVLNATPPSGIVHAASHRDITARVAALYDESHAVPATGDARPNTTSEEQ